MKERKKECIPTLSSMPSFETNALTGSNFGIGMPFMFFPSFSHHYKRTSTREPIKDGGLIFLPDMWKNIQGHSQFGMFPAPFPVTFKCPAQVQFPPLVRLKKFKMTFTGFEWGGVEIRKCPFLRQEIFRTRIIGRYIFKRDIQNGVQALTCPNWMLVRMMVMRLFEGVFTAFSFFFTALSKRMIQRFSLMDQLLREGLFTRVEGKYKLDKG